MPTYLTVAQVAEKLGLSVKTLQNRMSSGNAPVYYKPGKAALFREDEVNAWIESHRVEPAKVGGLRRD